MNKPLFGNKSLFLVPALAGTLASGLLQDASAATYYVRTDGADLATRTATSNNKDVAWKTLGFAVAKIKLANGGTGGGHTIQLGDGLFVEPAYIHSGESVSRFDQIVVPSNITIQGNGSHRSKVTVAASIPLDYKNPNDRYLIGGDKVSNVSFRGFSLDGKSRSVYGGIHIQGATLNFEGMRFSNFYHTGLFIHESWNENTPSTGVVVKSSAFSDNARGTSSNCSGNLTLSSSNGSVFQDLFISETLGAYGIKHYASSYPDQRLSIENDAVYKNITVDIPGTSDWIKNGNTTGNFSWEGWNTLASNVSLTNSTFTGGLSLANYNPSAPVNYDVGFNRFSGRYGSSYPIELKGGNVNFHDNAVNNYSWGIASTDSTIKSSNLKIERNLFHITGTQGHQLLDLNGGGDNNTIANNTILRIPNSTVPFIKVGPEAGTLITSSGWAIKNNIIADTSVANPPIAPNPFIAVQPSGKLTNLTLGLNLYWGIAKPQASAKISFSTTTPSGDSGTTTVNPNFPGTGNYPAPKYSSSSGYGAYSGSTNVTRGNLGHFIVLKSRWTPDAANPNSSIVSINGGGGSATPTYPFVNRLSSSQGLGNWERVALYYNEDGTLSFRATQANGTVGPFLTVMNTTYPGRLNASSATIAGDGEKFTINRRGDGSVAFRSKSKNLYVSVDGSGYLIANATDVWGDNQKFEIHAYAPIVPAPTAAALRATSAPSGQQF